jgi:glutaredoxin
MRPHELAAVILVGLTAAAPVAAQYYKWVGPGGAVTYSDRPPPAGTDAVSLGTMSTAARRDDSDLPAALRDPASKHPVVLYTSTQCAPCQQARAHLARRGVPFTERTIASSADADAFRRAGFQEASVPALAVGGERSVGYEASAWDRLLDAAGYPMRSMLPPSYRPSPPAPLASPSPAPAPRDANRANDAGGALERVVDAEPRVGGPARARVPRLELEPTPPAPDTIRF